MMPGRSGPPRPLFALAGLVLMALSACTRDEVPRPPRTPLRVAGAFAPLSTPLAQEYQQRLPHLDVTTVSSADSIDVIRDLSEGKVDVGVALADAAFTAYWGDPPVSAEEARKSPIRGMSLLQPLSAYVLVRANSGVRGIPDLNGRNVGLGPRTSSSSNLAYMVLDAFGVKANVTNVRTRQEGIAGLSSRRFDAVFLPGYVYPDDLTYTAVKAGAYLIPIEGPPLERLRWDYPFVRVATIPRDIYPGQNEVIPTVGIDMVVLCRRDLDESLVQQLVAELFNAYPQLSVVEASLRFLNINEAPATPIPLHPGAARYFREREVGR
jgi:TRAP transporter TAXI family solute receptor